MENKLKTRESGERVLRGELVRKVKVVGGRKHRRVFYVVAKRPWLARGVHCLTPEEEGFALISLLLRNPEPDDVAGLFRNLLAFVYDGEVPLRWQKGLVARPIENVHVAVFSMIEALNQRKVDVFRQHAWDLLSFVHKCPPPKNWGGVWRKYRPVPLVLFR